MAVCASLSVRVRGWLRSTYFLLVAYVARDLDSAARARLPDDGRGVQAVNGVDAPEVGPGIVVASRRKGARLLVNVSTLHGFDSTILDGLEPDAVGPEGTKVLGRLFGVAVKHVHLNRIASGVDSGRQERSRWTFLHPGR